MQQNRKMSVPPRWRLIMNTAVILGIFCFILFKSLALEPFPAFDVCVSVCIAILISAFLRSGVHYAFQNDCLEVRFLGIPFWRIPWDKIGTAAYLHAWKDISIKHSAAMGGVSATMGNTYGQIIYVTLKGCPKYHPRNEIRLFHNLLHPFRTACIWLPYATKHQYIEAFREYYPKLEMQPLDDWKKF